MERAYSDTVKRGTVISSDPGSGERIRGNDAVKLVISRGPEIVKVPDVESLALAEARRELKKTGLAPGMVTREFSEEIDRGKVIRTDPRAYTERHPDSAVALVVSKGSPVDVPDLTGLSVEDAKDALDEAGLKAKVLPDRVNSPEEAA